MTTAPASTRIRTRRLRWWRQAAKLGSLEAKKNLATPSASISAIAW
jgi:hypothetical protein